MKSMYLMKKSGRMAFMLGLTVGLTALWHGAMADTIKLKDGSEITGKIVMETSDFIKIELKASATIKESKLIKVSDIEKVLKSSPDDLAWEKIQKLVPSKSLQSAATYKTMIETGPRDFLKKFPSSQYKSKVGDILKTLEEELDKVERGHQKIGEKWYSPEDRRNFAILVSAKKKYMGMKSAAGRSDLFGLIQAMRSFEDLEEKHFGTPAHAQAVGGAKSILNALNGIGGRFLRDAPTRQKQWELDLASQDTTSQARMKAARAREVANLNRQVAMQKAKGYQWVPVDIRSAESLGALLTLVKTEATRLNGIDIKALTERSEKLFEIDNMILKGQLPQAKLALVNIEDLPAEKKHAWKSTSRKKSSKNKKKPAVEVKAPVYTSYFSELNGKLNDKLFAITQAEEKMADAAESAKVAQELKEKESTPNQGDMKIKEGDKANLNPLAALAQAPTEDEDKDKDKAGPKKRPRPTKTKKAKRPSADAEDDEVKKTKKKPSKPIPIQLIGVIIAALLGIAIFVMKKTGIGGATIGGKKDE